MESRNPAPQETQKDASPLDVLIDKLSDYGGNASRNLSASFTGMTTLQWIRLVVIIGGYILIRSRLNTWLQKRAVEQMGDADRKEKAAAREHEHENQDADVDDEPVGVSSGGDWGSKAKIRQRTVLKQMMEAEERRLQDLEDDKEIEEFLED